MTSLCILGEICLEIHGVLSEKPPSSGAAKSTTILQGLEVSLGGCGVFGVATATSSGIPTQLIAHVGSEYPFPGLNPLNSQWLDEILGAASSIDLIADGESGVFFSFWQQGSQSRMLYGKPGRGLRGADLERIRINADRIALLSQSDPGVYAKIHHVAAESDALVVCAPNQALGYDRQLLLDYLAWGDVLVVSRPEAEEYFGEHPEGTLIRSMSPRKSFVVITAADQDVSVISPDGSCRSVPIPRKADVALLGAGDSFAAALSCFWGRFSLTHTVRNAAAKVLDVQYQFRPKITDGFHQTANG